MNDMTALGEARPRTDRFCHEAALYAGNEGFMEATLPFIGEALRAREPILVAVDAEKIRRLRSGLGTDSDQVQFADIAELGANPAQIIPAWQRFLDDRPESDGRVWGIGEPIGPDRSGDMLIECQLHESLLNVAFADTRSFNLLCPYDTEALDPGVIAEAHQSHPLISHDSVREPSLVCRDLATAATPCAIPLSPAPFSARMLPFDNADHMSAIRRFVQRRARAAGLGDRRAHDLVLAVNELVANSLVHGGGRGVLRVWDDPEWVVGEVTDQGRIGEPLVGRRQPTPGQNGGWGLWLANQVCDLVQVRSYDAGSAVRVHVRR